jgi:hypothetical protein
MESASNAIFEVLRFGAMAGGLYVSVLEPIVGSLIICGDLDPAGNRTLIITRGHEAGALADDLGKAA